LLIPSCYLGGDQYWYRLGIFIYLYTTGSISVGCYRLWIIEMSETNKNNNIKGSSVGQTWRKVEM